MYHRIHGYVSGNSTEARFHADMMDTFEASNRDGDTYEVDVVKESFLTMA